MASSATTHQVVLSILALAFTGSAAAYVFRGHVARTEEAISRLQAQLQRDQELYEAKLQAEVARAKRETRDRFIQLGFTDEHEAHRKRLPLRTGSADRQTSDEDIDT